MNMESSGEFLTYEFGTGQDMIVVLPSLMDSFKSCLDSQSILKRTWEKLASKYRLLFISRPDQMPYKTTESIAEALIELIPKCKAIIGISMGGLIAQHVLNKAPNITSNLILAMSCSQQSNSEIKILENWLSLSNDENWEELQKSTLEVIYNKPFKANSSMKLVVAKPRTKQLLVNSIDACISHNSSSFIGNIDIKCLVIACEYDALFPLEQMKLFTSSLKNSILYVLENASHGLHGKYLTEMQTRIDEFLD